MVAASIIIRQLRMDRITVAELRRLIDDGQEIGQSSARDGAGDGGY
jgi:hypothetical protein